MTVHYYHCTDGVDLVLDRVGHRTRSAGELHSRACRVAEELMNAIPPEIDWAHWIVSVHDKQGTLIEAVPFPVASRRAAA
jgi:hypothetical protein